MPVPLVRYNSKFQRLMYLALNPHLSILERLVFPALSPVVGAALATKRPVIPCHCGPRDGQVRAV